MQSLLTKASEALAIQPHALLSRLLLSRRVVAACGGWGVPGGWLPGAGPAVSGDSMQKYCFMPQKVNYASFTRFCLLLFPSSSLLL